MFLSSPEMGCAGMYRNRRNACQKSQNFTRPLPYIKRFFFFSLPLPQPVTSQPVWYAAKENHHNSTTTAGYIQKQKQEKNKSDTRDNMIVITHAHH